MIFDGTAINKVKDKPLHKVPTPSCFATVLNPETLNIYGCKIQQIDNIYHVSKIILGPFQQEPFVLRYALGNVIDNMAVLAVEYFVVGFLFL